MRKHGGTPSWRHKHVTPAAISPPGVARGRFVGGQQSGLAGCKPPPLSTRGASSCLSQGRRQGGTMGRLSTTECTYPPTYLLEPTCLRSLTDMPSALKSMTSVSSSLFDEFRLLTRHAGELIRELVSSTTAWPLVLVRRKPIDGPLVDIMRSPSKSPIRRICGARTLGNSRTFGISIRPRHKHWDLDNFERLPVKMSSYSNTSAPSTADLVIPTFHC